MGWVGAKNCWGGMAKNFRGRVAKIVLAWVSKHFWEWVGNKFVRGGVPKKIGVAKFFGNRVAK